MHVHDVRQAHGRRASSLVLPLAITIKLYLQRRLDVFALHPALETPYVIVISR